MTARMYVASNVTPAGLKGQAAEVWSGLQECKEQGPMFAADINKIVGPRLKTKQDTLRVTLYYIVIFKGKGWVTAVDPVITPVAESNELDETMAAISELIAG